MTRGCQGSTELEKIVHSRIYIEKSLRLPPRFETTYPSFPYSGRLQLSWQYLLGTPSFLDQSSPTNALFCSRIAIVQMLGQELALMKHPCHKNLSRRLQSKRYDVTRVAHSRFWRSAYAHLHLVCEVVLLYVENVADSRTARIFGEVVEGPVK
jgi:hypothetical protein